MLFFCPALFIISLRLYFSFLCVATSWLSHALQVWWYPNPRGNYWENISGYQRLSGSAPSQFLQLVFLKSWMKNDNPQSSEPLDGESDSQAIRNLVQILKPSAAAQSLFLLLWSEALIQNQHSQGGKHPGFYFLCLCDLKQFDSVKNTAHCYGPDLWPGDEQLNTVWSRNSEFCLNSVWSWFRLLSSQDKSHKSAF